MHINVRHARRLLDRAGMHVSRFNEAVYRETMRRAKRADNEPGYGFIAHKPQPSAAFTRRTVTRGAIIGTETERDGDVVLYSRHVLMPMMIEPRTTSKYQPNEEQRNGKR